MTFPDEEPEPSKGGDYPIGDAERESAGLPPLSSDRRDKPNPPQLVKTALLLWLVSAALLIVGFALMVLNSDEITARLVEDYERAQRAGDPLAQRSGVTPGAVAAGVRQLIWALAVGGAMMAALLLLFAHKAREGTRSARTVLVVLLGVFIALAFGLSLGGPFVNPVMVAAIVVGCVAAVLMFLPGAAGYFPQLPRTRRRWRDYS